MNEFMARYSSLQFERQALRTACTPMPTNRRWILDEWLAPLVVWAAVIAMGVAVAGMLLGEN